jgi:hypothetical protein
MKMEWHEGASDMFGAKSKLRQQLADLYDADESDADEGTRLLRLAVALNTWKPTCVSRIECGAICQDDNYVGEIQLILSCPSGTGQVQVRASWFGNLITFIDPNKAIDSRRDCELRKIFQSFGFVYVPHRILKERCGKAGGFTTWFDRYFSYMNAYRPLK